MTEIESIGLVGAGQMGNGIAHVAACAGFRVQLTDISDAALSRAVGTIEKNLGRMVKKEKISDGEASAALARAPRTLCAETWVSLSNISFKFTF